MILWQHRGQSLQTVIVLQHVVAFCQPLLVTALMVVLHCIDPGNTNTFTR